MPGAEIDPKDHDAFLVKGLRENDPVVILSFMDRYQDPIIFFVMKECGIPRDDAEEIASAAMMKVADKIDKFDAARGSFCTWIFTIAKNEGIDYLRRRARKPKGNGPLVTLESIVGVFNGDQAAVPAASTNPILKDLFVRAYGSLREEDRTVLSLAAKEWSYAEIGEVLGKSQEAVKVQAHRARKSLREAVKELADAESIDVSEADWDGLKHWKGQKEVEL